MNLTRWHGPGIVLLLLALSAAAGMGGQTVPKVQAGKAADAGQNAKPVPAAKPAVEVKGAASAVPAGDLRPERATDARLAAAEVVIGRALFLRGFAAGAELSYDAGGNLRGEPRPLDWTLAGMDVTAVTQSGPAELSFAGVRVAIRYNAEGHTFDRHALKAEPLRVVLAEPADAAGVTAALGAMFSTGIDVPMQRSTSAVWRHYFEPAMPWMNDSLTGAVVFGVGGKVTAGLEAPVAVTQETPEYTDEARLEKVQGVVVLRMVVDPAGVPRRISIARPLGYGLDEKAAEALGKWRFKPGMQGGKAVPVEMTVDMDFNLQRR